MQFCAMLTGVLIPAVFAAAPAALMWFIIHTRIQEIGRITTVGVLIWTAGFGLVLHSALRDDAHLPSLGHLLWVAALPVMASGTFLVKGAHRLYIGPLMIFDVLLVSITWLMLIWKVCIWRAGMNGLSDVPWPVLLIMLCEVAVFALIGQFAGNLPEAPMTMLAVGAAQFVIADALLLWADGDRPIHLARLVLLFAGIVIAALALTFQRAPENRPLAELQRAGRVRGIVTVVLAALPLSLYIVTMAGGQADAGSLVLSGALVATFACREVYRSRQNRALVTALAGQALQDPLTGLPNRRALEEELRYRGGPEGTVSVMTIDVDRFKDVNRELGHSAGDEVLIAVARSLSQLPEVAQHRASACRLGGDEFALVAAMQHPEATALASRIQSIAVEAVAAVPGVAPLGITLSIGVAAAEPQERKDAPFAVLTRSGQALRVAKEERNVVRYFSDADARLVAEQAGLELRLRTAVTSGQVRFVYEPIVDLSSGRVVSLETLARWDDGGVDVPPTLFIPIAEQIGLVHEIGWQSLRESIALRARLRSEGTSLGVSVNVSPVQLRRPGFQADLLHLLHSHDVPPSDLTLEVTEGVFIDLDDPAVGALFRLHDAGVRIAIDDFGTGYSSLGYMSRLPAHVLKVDKSLTRRIDTPKHRAIVQALLDVAAAHEVPVVVEGVDAEPVRTGLLRMGALYGQGWLFSCGEPAQDVSAMLHRLGVSARPAEVRLDPAPTAEPVAAAEQQRGARLGLSSPAVDSPGNR